MNAISPHTPNLDDVLAFNDTLLKLQGAGIPIGLGDDSETERSMFKRQSSESLEIRLSEISAKIAMCVARGSTVREVLESDRELPPLYCSSLKTWLYCGNSPDALNALSEHGGIRRNIQQILSFSILQPLILLVLVYFGFLYLLVGVAPKMQSISLQTGSVSGLGLRSLMFARQYVWLGAVLGPVLVALSLLVWRRFRSQASVGWFPGQKVISESIRNANYADTVSNLLMQDYTEEQSLLSVGSLNRKDTDSLNAGFPPLLRWAFGDDVNREDRVNALRFSARGYREIALRKTGRMRSWFPVLAGSLLGGTFVLIFGLSLFEPMIELLFALTRP